MAASTDKKFNLAKFERELIIGCMFGCVSSNVLINDAYYLFRYLVEACLHHNEQVAHYIMQCEIVSTHEMLAVSERSPSLDVMGKTQDQRYAAFLKFMEYYPLSPNQGETPSMSAKPEVAKTESSEISKPSKVKKVATRTLSNLRRGTKIKLAGKANRAAVKTTISLIPNAPEWLHSPQVESGLLWIGPTVMQIVSINIEDIKSAPEQLKVIIQQAADAGQIDAAINTTDQFLIPMAGVLMEIVKNYVVAFGGKAAAGMITQDMMVELMEKIMTNEVKEEASV